MFIRVALFAVFGAWLTELKAQPSPPLSFENEEGTVYILVTDAQNKPILVNGSPLYQGTTWVGGDRFETFQTLSSIEKKAKVRSWEQNSHSPWVEQSLELELGGATLERFLSRFEEDPVSFRKLLSGTSDPKAAFLRSLLFRDEVVLTKDDLIAIRTSAQEPNPTPVQIRFPVEDRPKWAKATSEWYIQIGIQELSFKFRKKVIRLDPLQNLIRVRLECTGAVLKGPTQSIGRVDLVDFYKYPIPFADYWPFGIGTWLDEKRKHYWKVDNELISGDVGPLSLEVDIRFFQDRNGMWRIGLADNLRFVAEGDDPKVKLTYRDPVPTKEGPSTQQDLPLTAWAQNIIAETLTETLSGAFSSSLFPEDLAFGLEIGDLPPFSNDSHSFIQTRLSKFRISDKALSVTFDSRVLSEKPSQCIYQKLPQELPLKKTEPLESKEHFRDEIWTLERSAQTGGKWSTGSGTNAGLQLRLSAGFAEVVHLGLFLKGHYCASTAQWPSRSGAIPKTNFRPTEIPQLQLAPNALEFDFTGEIGFFARNYADRNEVFELKKLSSVNLKPKLILEGDPSKLRIDGLNSIHFKTMSQAENELIREVLGEALSKAVGGSLFSDGLLISDSLTTLSGQKVSVEKWNIAQDELTASLVLSDAFFEGMYKSELKTNPDRARYEEPLSVLSDSIPYVISDRFVTLNWKSPTDSPFFSWRYREFPKGDWSPWTEFNEDLSTTFPKPKPGKYEFQVKAMNLNYEIERIPSSVQFLVPEEERIRGLNDDDENWTQPPRPERKENENPSTVKAGKRAADQGLFGCSLSSPEAERSQNPWLLLGLLLTLSIVRLRVRHRAECKFRPTADEVH